MHIFNNKNRNKNKNNINDNDVYLYHGTTRDRLPTIMREGLKVMPVARHLPDTRKPHTVHLTTSKNEAIRYAQQSFKKHKPQHNLGTSELSYRTGFRSDPSSWTHFHPRIPTPSERRKAVLLRIKMSIKEFNEKKTSGQLPGDSANMLGFKLRKFATQVEASNIEPSRIEVLDVKKESFPFFKK